MDERRRERSENPWMAGDLYLQRIAEQRGLGELTLATREGLLLSGTGDREVSNRLAAVAPVFAEEPATLKPGMLEEMAEGQPVQLWRVTIRERPFNLESGSARRPTCPRRSSRRSTGSSRPSFRPTARRRGATAAPASAWRCPAITARCSAATS